MDKLIRNEINDIKITSIAAAVSDKYTPIEESMNYADIKEIEKFKKMTGILGRYDVTEKQTSSDLCFAAANNICAKGKYVGDDIGVLIYVTQTPDYRTPSTAYALHQRLSLPNDCICFDVNLGCSGFVYGSTLVASLMATSNIQKGLLLIGDTNAKERLPKNKTNTTNTSMLFGDAGAAVLFEKRNGCQIKSSLRSDGTGFKALMKPYGTWRHPTGPERVPSDDIAVFNFTINEVPDLIKDFILNEGKTIDDYDQIVLHQANLYIIKQIAKRLRIPMEKVPTSLDKYGNTSGASIPITLVEKYGETNETKELNLLMSGFGVGLSSGVMSAQINVNDILPLVHTDEYFDDGIAD